MLAESMLASHAALCWSTGSLEIFVFQTLLAGNAGQFGAPGTVVPASNAASAGDDDAVGVAPLADVAGLAEAASVAARPVRLPAAVCALYGLVPDDGAAPQAARHVPIMMSVAVPSGSRRAMKCPDSRLTVASWHARADPAR